MAREQRKKAYRKGLWAEGLAALLLTLKGYRVLQRRYRSPVGEIDIVAVRRRRLVFVEVKARESVEAAAHSVTVRQRRRIARAAAHWLARRPAYAGHDVSFDVVLLAPWSRPRHLSAAFDV